MTSAPAVNSKNLGARRLRQDIVSQKEGRLRERLKRSSLLREKQIAALDFLADNLASSLDSRPPDQHRILSHLVNKISSIFEFSACGLMWVNPNRMFELYDVSPQGSDERIHKELARLRETGALVRVLQNDKPALKESTEYGEWLVYHAIRNEDRVLGLMVGVLPDQGMIDGVLLKLFEVILRNSGSKLVELGDNKNGNVESVFHIQQDDLELYGHRLKFVSERDRLTGIANRENFLHHLDVLIDSVESKPLAVASFDFEEFGRVNDSYGYEAGNTVLVQAAERLQKMIADEEQVSSIVPGPHALHLARVGEDEFGLVAELSDGVTDEQLKAFVQALLDDLLKTYRLESSEVTLSGSAGISRFPKDARDPGTLLIHTLRARIETGKSGSNSTTLYDSSMAEADSGKLLMRTQELSDGIKGSQLHTWFQPRMNLQSGEIVGAEALLRWQHPEQGLLLPQSFVPLAETSGLIRDLGEGVLRDACRLITQADDAGSDEFQVSINLSSAQLLDESLVTNFRAILNTHQGDASRIELEVAEICFSENLERISSVLCELAEIGFRISIDDFGKGATSLAALRNLPVSLLKIDQTFVQGLQKDRANRAIINALVAMGRDLNVKTLAEGVETEPQLNDIKALGCDQVQGYFLSKPSAPASFKELMSQWSTTEPALA